MRESFLALFRSPSRWRIESRRRNPLLMFTMAAERRVQRIFTRRVGSELCGLRRFAEAGAGAELFNDHARRHPSCVSSTSNSPQTRPSRIVSEAPLPLPLPLPPRLPAAVPAVAYGELSWALLKEAIPRW